MIEQDKEHNSQFLYGCNTDWNLNQEFICWLNYWFKVYKEKTKGIVDLGYHKYDYKGETLTQLQIIDKIIELTDKIHTYYYEYDTEQYKELENDVNEVFDLFKLVYWCMWW